MKTEEESVLKMFVLNGSGMSTYLVVVEDENEEELDRFEVGDDQDLEAVADKLSAEERCTVELYFFEDLIYTTTND